MHVYEHLICEGRFFQAFMAAMPHHPLIKRALDYMVAYYEETLDQILPQFIVSDIKRKQKTVPSRKHPGGMGVGPFTLAISHRSTTDEDWDEYVRDLLKNHRYSGGELETTESIASKWKYARVLYEISLENELVTSRGIWADIPHQDATYKKKVRWCNFVCFAASVSKDDNKSIEPKPVVHFFSRVPGSKGCPLEK